MFWKQLTTPTKPKPVEEKAAAVLAHTRQRLHKGKQAVDHYGALLQQAWKRQSLAGSTAALLTEPLRTIITFDVRVPPAKRHVVAGKLVPTVRGGLLAPATTRLFARPRRIALEIHGPPADMRLDGVNQNNKQSAGKEDDLALEDYETVVVRVYKATESSIQPEEEEEDDDNGNNDETSKDHFLSMQALSAEDIVLLDRRKATCEVQVGHGDDTKVYNVIFRNELDAINFAIHFNMLRDCELERSKKQAQSYIAEKATHQPDTISAHSDEEEEEEEEEHTPVSINLLVEIVSATNLPEMVNPFVSVKMGQSLIHRTKVLAKTNEPVWSLATGSLFLIQKSPEEFFASTAGMTFILADSPSFLGPLGPVLVIGKVRLDLHKMLEMQGKRVRFDVAMEKRKNAQDPISTPSSSGCALYLRIKAATESEIAFMKTYEMYSGLVGVYADETYLLPNPPALDFFKRAHKFVPVTPNSRKLVALRRVRPYPDPERPKETKWLLSHQIELESRRHSTSWVKAGSGDLGNLFVEILACNGLPNLSLIRTSNILDRTSPFVCVVYEDAVVNTDAIADCLSPRWMPWSKRAFALPMVHPQSDLYLGVFDYDMELSPLQMALTTTRMKRQHNRIGRCSVCLTQLNPDTTYELTYPLFLDGLQEERTQPRGTITIRLRLQFNNTRKTMLAALIPPVRGYVSCPRKIDWEVAKYTVEGVHDPDRYNINSFARYVAELQGYEQILPYLEEVLLTCLLWRGHFKICIFRAALWLPLHSMVAFGWALLIYRDLNYIPSFLVFSIAWMFLAANEIVRRTPSPWEKPRGYLQLLSILLFGSFFLRDIEPDEGLEELREFRESEDRNQHRRERARQLRAAYEKKLREELGLNVDELEVEDIATKAADDLADTLHLQPLKPILYPVQKKLRKIVLVCRFVSRFFLWKEAYYSFWITTFALLFSLSIAFIPWGWFLGWSIQTSLLALTGPWWKLVDWCFFRHPTEKMTDEEYDAHVRNKLQKRIDQVIRAISAFQIKKERAIKLKSMQQYLYGKYIVRIPRVSLNLFTDVPLPESSCQVRREDQCEPVNVTEQKYGQNLRGDMIPIRQIEDSYTGQADTLKKVRMEPFERVKRIPWRIVSMLNPFHHADKRKDGGAGNTEATPLLS